MNGSVGESADLGNPQPFKRRLHQAVNPDGHRDCAILYEICLGLRPNSL